MSPMSFQLATLAAAAVLSLPAQAVTLVQWDFEGATTPPDLADSPLSPVVAASLGSGSAMGVHASAATDWSTPVGNGSFNAFSSNNWAVGDHYQFSFSTSGYADVSVSVDQIGSGTGPRDFSLAWSTDGSSFTAVADYSVLSTPAFSSTTYNPLHTYSFDLSAIDALDDQATVLIRLTNSSTISIGGGTVGTGGTGRVDNFTVMATPVPEAGSLPMLLAGLATVGFLARRRSA